MDLENIFYLIGSIILVILILKLSKKILQYFLLLIIGAVIFFAFSSCSKGNLNISNNMENVEENTLLRINDIPFIKKSKIDIEKSLILGEGKSWSGQILLNVPSPKSSVFNFYVNNIGDFGWKEQTTIRGETSILNYVGDNNRVIIISLNEARFNNTDVLISVSPYTEEFQQKVGEFINDKYLDIKDWQKD
tara:strand:- start:720 stop:1292 length:573 start_codon:yes stop_codon:yes gene_type:complete